MTDHCIGRQYGAYKAHPQRLIGAERFAQQQALGGALITEKLRQEQARGRPRGPDPVARTAG